MGALYVYLVLSSFLATGYSTWMMRSSHSNIIPGLTDNVTLQCFYERNGVDDLSPLSRIRLLKLVNQEWKMYVQILHPNPSQPIFDNPNQPGVSAAGRLGQPRDTHLSVTWSSASDGTVGSYRCEVDGFTPNDGNNDETFSEVVNITNHEVTVSDLLDVIVQMRRRSDQMSLDLQSMEGRHASQRQVLENRMMSHVDSDVEDNYFEVRYWPTGPYSLLTDAHGCPNTSFSNFSNGYVLVQTETTNPPQHVFPDQFNCTHCTNCGFRNVLRFNFCVNNRVEPRLLWPKGSYCIQRWSRYCPAAFNFGYTRSYLKSMVNLIVARENADISFPTHVSYKYMDYHFCCRSDGNVNTPILLPNARPFYLFRYGGSCQAVYNMDVTNENIQLDTDGTRRDSFSNVYHADGTINKVRLELCSYTKRNTSANYGTNL